MTYFTIIIFTINFMKSLEFYFSTQHPNEKILYVIHRHWFNIAQQFFALFIVMIMTMLGALMTSFFLTNAGSEEYAPLIFFIASFFMLLLWIYAFFIWVDYFLVIWIVKSARVIDIEQKGFFARKVSELDYTHVQDVTSDITGLFQTLFGYVDVHVQTAGTHGQFMFRRIAQPEKIKTLVMHLHRQALSKRIHPDVISKERARRTL